MMKKIIVIGIGNPLRSDQWIGCYATRLLEKELDQKSVRFLVAGTRFRQIEEIAKFDPTNIFILTAFNLKKKPGEIRIIDPRRVQDLLSEEYEPNLAACIKKLKQRTRAIIRIIGIQPKQTEYGKELSDEVKGSVPKIKKELREFL